LDAGFLDQLDADASGAIRRLEAAFRDKIKAVAKNEAKIAAAGDGHHDAGHDAHDREGSETHHESGLLAGLSPLLLLAGLAVAGGAVALAAGGGGDDRDDTPAPAPNADPVAANDAVTTSEDTAVTFDVRTNDSDANGGTLAVTQINGTALTTSSPVAITGGTISLGADGRLTFTPAANFNGTPSFTYTLSDGQGGTANATVNLTVSAVNDAPVANADSFTTAEDTAVTIAVRANDTDVDGDPLVVTQVNGTAITATTGVTVNGGTVTLDTAGNLVFTPAANFNGTPSFTYTVSDGRGGTATATVSGTVTPVNDAPVNALPVTVGAVAQGAAVVIPGLSVSDVDGDAGTFTTRLSVQHGTLIAATVPGGATIAGSGSGAVTLTGTLAQVNASLKAISYTSAAGFSGAETLTVSTSDGQLTDTDTLPLTVAQVTQGVVIDGYVAGARIFFDANGNGQYDEGEVVATTDDQGRFVLVGEPRGTMVALGGTNTDTGLPNTIALKAPAGSAAVTPLTTLVASLVEAGADLSAAQAQVARAFGLPAGLDLTSFDFLSAGNDPALAFQVQKVALQIATVMIQAQAAGVGPAAVAGLAQLASGGAAIDLGDPARLTALLTAAGADPDAAAAAAQKAASINLAIAAATSPGALVDTVRDLNRPNADLPPIALADAGKFGLGVPATMAVLANDSDPEGRGLSVVAVDGRPIAIGQSIDVANGTVTLGENGVLTFTPANGFLGSQSFTYTVADAAGGTTTATATASLAGPVLPVSADRIDFAVANAPELAAAGIHTLDATGDAATLSDAQAQALIGAGIDFAEGDTVTLQADGTVLNTSLKGLQALHVDAIAVGAGVSVLAVDAGGTLGSLSAADLPSFVVAQSDAALDVTLTVSGGLIDPATDLTAVAAALGAAGIDHLGVAGDGRIALSLPQATALAAGGLDFAAAADVTLDVDAGSAVALANDPALLAGLRVDHLDVAGDAVTIDDVAAARLVAAGVDFVAADDVTLQADGTVLNTSLKGLQALHVDAIAVGAGVTALAVDAGGTLGSLSAADLPSFVVAQDDAALDVTLNVEAGTLDPAFDLSQLATALGGAGIDHLGVTGGGLALDLTQARALAGAGLDFVPAADITLDVAAGDVAGIAADPSLVASLGVDHLDVAGAVRITEAQAAGLVGAGVDFAEANDVTLQADGTVLNISLKGLQALHVDAVAVGAGVAVLGVAAGGGLDGISATDLPSFVVNQSDAALDVTLTVDAGTLSAGFDAFALAPALADAGIDHIGVAGTGALGLSLQQAWGVGAAGLDFVAADVTVNLSRVELAGIATPGEAAILGGIGVDTLDVIEDRATIGDDQAANLVAAGLHFAESDAITVAAEGTQLNTSLKGLHDLKVDAVAVAAGVSALHVDAGDLTGISASDLPQFDVAQSDEALDVTLRVDAGEIGEIERLAQGLREAGVDHIALNQPLDTLTPDQAELLAAVTARFGIDFAFEPFDKVEARTIDPADIRAEAELLSELRDAHVGADDDGTGGTFRIEDGAHHALAESGLLRAFTADHLVIDGTGSADTLQATLKDIADMGVDEVQLADGHGAPVYVELGLEGEGADEIVQLLRSLDTGRDGPEPIFQGSDKVALVLDADAAHQLAGVDGAAEQLKAIGITEIDVLADDSGVAAPAFGDVGLEVKLIGQDDDLYRQLHHDR